VNNTAANDYYASLVNNVFTYRLLIVFR